MIGDVLRYSLNTLLIRVFTKAFAVAITKRTNKICGFI
ncbi:hypothetical protein CSC12_0514 [Klebsiella michiganensis]|nr:hypothetical protein CSC12_0514 [Klebsiella michiganensis]